ncbi:MAG: hypothetical protein HY862_06445 [Chloroflexi bacterium]|nr:hypothetical protein [Chloroflexota bacterium]
MKKALGGLLMVILLAGNSFVRAQDGLTPEQETLLDRAIAAVAARDDYESFVRADSEMQQQNVTLSVPSLNLTQIQLNKLTREGTANVAQGDKHNIQAKVVATVDQTIFNADGTQDQSASTLNAEIRLVDDVLYVNATSDDAQSNIPTGWVEVDDPVSFEVFGPLGLSNYVEPGLFSDVDKLRPAVQNVRLEERTLENGQTADYIIIDLGYEGIQTVLSRNVDPNDVFTAFLLLSVNENSTFTLTIGLDENDRLIESSSDMNLRTDQVDAHALRPTDFPDGTFVKYEGHYLETSSYSHINEPLEAVESPIELTQ